MKMWKVLGVAGLAGVAATGVIVARDERRRSQLTPDDVRARLHERYAATRALDQPDPGPATAVDSPDPRSRLRRWTARAARRARRR